MRYKFHPLNPNKKPTFSKPILFIDWYAFNGLSMLLLKWIKIVWSKRSRYFFGHNPTDSSHIMEPSWSYGSWIYNYMCNHCLSPLKLWVWTPFMARCTRYNIMWYSLSVTVDRSVVFSGDCTGSCKSNYHMIMTTKACNVFNLEYKYNYIYI
jgi:hypothetical protein